MDPIDYSEYIQLEKSLYGQTKDFHHLLSAVLRCQEVAEHFEQNVIFPEWVCKAIVEGFITFAKWIDIGERQKTLDQAFGITSKLKENMGDAIIKRDKNNLYWVMCEIKYLFQLSSNEKAAKLAWEYAEAWNSFGIEGMKKPVCFDLGKIKDAKGLAQDFDRFAKGCYENYVSWAASNGLQQTERYRKDFLDSAPLTEEQKKLFGKTMHSESNRKQYTKRRKL